MLKGSTPVRLSQIDMSPFVRAAKMNEAASLNLSNAVTKSISDFTKKQEEKRQKDASIESIMEMLGLDKKTATAVYNDEAVREAFKIQQKSQGDLVRKQREQLQLEILQGEQKRVQEQREIFEKAITVNTTPEGKVDMSGVRQSFADLGGRDEGVFGDLFNVRGEVEISDKGVITQDTPEGPKFLGQVPQSALGKEPTQEEKEKTKLDLEKSRTEIEKLRAQIAKIESEMPTTEFDPEKLEGIDKEAYDYAIANPGTPESEEILKRLGAK